MKYATLVTSLLVAIVVVVALSGGDAGAYERYNSGCQATGCHGAFTSAVSPKGSTIPSNNKHTMHRNAAYMATKCALCHRSDDNNDPFIGSSDGTTINLGIGCTGCHPGSAAYPTRHSNNASANIVTIPNYPTVGINTAYGGIHLGGDNTSGTTEAQICWNCHDAETVRVTEWGPNQHASTGNKPFNFGQLCTNGSVTCDNPASANWNSNWTTGNCRSAYDNSSTTLFNYKRGNIQSTHSANPTAGVHGMDAVGNIRCSYCHDVHNRNLAPNDTYSGNPYLRGGWITSPYNQDGAPISGQTYDSLEFGAVTRGPLAYGAVANLGAWLAYGAAFLLVARATLPLAPLGLHEALGAYTASYVAGVLAPFAPGGIGVREGVLVLALEPRMGLANALALAALSRLGVTVAEVLASVGFLIRTPRSVRVESLRS